MTLSAKNVLQINKMNRASQNALLGTAVKELQDANTAFGSMSLQSASFVDITGGTISGTNISGSIKIGGSSDYTLFESDGTMVCTGSSTTWEDLRFPATAINPAGAPSAMGFDTSNIGFTASDGATQVIAIIAQMPHSWKMGSNIYPHIHWEPTNATSGSVLWRMEYKWTNIGSVESASFTSIESLTAASGSAYMHQLASFPSISGSGKTLSSILSIFISRIGGDSSDTYGATALLKEFDIHYQSDTLGSREEFTK